MTVHRTTVAARAAGHRSDLAPQVPLAAPSHTPRSVTSGFQCRRLRAEQGTRARFSVTFGVSDERATSQASCCHTPRTQREGRAHSARWHSSSCFDHPCRTTQSSRYCPLHDHDAWGADLCGSRPACRVVYQASETTRGGESLATDSRFPAGPRSEEAAANSRTQVVSVASALRFTCRYGSLGKMKHVGALRVVGTTAAFIGRQRAIRINLSLEALQELLARWPSAGAAIDRSTPRDLCRDLPVDVLACYAIHLPLRLRSVLVSAFVSAGMFARLSADAHARRETRQAVRRSLIVMLLGGGRAPTAAADLNRAASLGMLG